MTVLSAQTIQDVHRLINPFHQRTVEQGMTFGLSSCGYDVRIAEDHMIYSTMVLGSTIERFRMPHHIMGVVHDKSSWGRKGLAVQNTVIEPGWEGYLTLELSNHSGKPIVISAGMPIAQIVFHYLDQPTNFPYKGKYQNQESGPQPARDEV